MSEFLDSLQYVTDHYEHAESLGLSYEEYLELIERERIAEQQRFMASDSLYDDDWG